MKKLALLAVLVSMRLSAQISIETTYTSPTPTFNTGLIKLSASGYKYFVRDSNSIVIYNLSHTVFRSFVIPPLPTTANQISVRYVSEELFNTNPADIEYLVYYTDTIGPSIGIQHVVVFDETGNILFSRDSAQISNGVFNPSIPFQGITATSSGVKMLITRTHTANVEVYALPGILPCQECSGGIISGIAVTEPSGIQPVELPNPFPNPTNGTTTIPYSLPSGINTGVLIIYDVLGQEVKRLAVTNSFESVILDSGELSAGTYTYVLSTIQGNIPGNKFVVSD